MVCLRPRSTLLADVAPDLSSSSRQRGVLGSQSAIPDDGGRHALPSHSFAVINILECSFVNYIMSHPLLHSAISSSPVIAGFINDGLGFDLPMVSLCVITVLHNDNTNTTADIGPSDRCSRRC